MNIKTLLLLIVIGAVGVGAIATSIAGSYLPTQSSAQYIRQSATERQVQGGGTSFGK